MGISGILTLRGAGEMNRLRELRKAKGLTQVELAKQIGIGQSGYSDWERGVTKMDSGSAAKLAALFSVSVGYLLGTDDEVEPSFRRIPVLGSVPAGVPIDAVEDIVDWEDLPESMFAGNKEYFALEVHGDSMWPDYLPGDIVIVRRDPCCESGDICVVYVNGYEATLKQVKLGEDGSITLVPKNQSYPPRTYLPEEAASLPVTICGVVVELRRKIKKGKGRL